MNVSYLLVESRGRLDEKHKKPHGALTAENRVTCVYADLDKVVRKHGRPYQTSQSIKSSRGQSTQLESIKSNQPIKNQLRPIDLIKINQNLIKINQNISWDQSTYSKSIKSTNQNQSLNWTKKKTTTRHINRYSSVLFRLTRESCRVVQTRWGRATWRLRPSIPLKTNTKQTRCLNFFCVLFFLLYIYRVPLWPQLVHSNADRYVHTSTPHQILSAEMPHLTASDLLTWNKYRTRNARRVVRSPITAVRTVRLSHHHTQPSVHRFQCELSYLAPYNFRPISERRVPPPPPRIGHSRDGAKPSPLYRGRNKHVPCRNTFQWALNLDCKGVRYGTTFASSMSRGKKRWIRHTTTTTVVCP